MANSRNYWRNPQNAKLPINYLTKKLGHKPTLLELKRNGYRSLEHAIYESDTLARELDYKISRKLKSPKKLTTYQTIRNKVEGIVINLGYFPQKEEFKNIGYEDLLKEIADNNLSYNKIKNSIVASENYSIVNQTNNWELVKSKLIEMYNSLGHFPTRKEIQLLYPRLVQGIYNYHGGMKKIQKKFYKETKLPVKNIRSVEWSLENIKKVADKIVKKYKGFPNFDILKSEYSSFLKATRYYGGFYEFRRKFGYDVKTRPRNYLKSLKNIKKELLKLKVLLGHLPKYEELDRGLASGINEYHGGLISVYSKLGYMPTKSVENFVNYVENHKIAKFIVEKFGNDISKMADILKIIIEEKGKSKENLSMLINQPSLKEWLGNYSRGINNIRDLAEIEKKILPLDKNGIIEDILKDVALDFMRKKLGNNPSKIDKSRFLKELNNSLYEND